MSRHPSGTGERRDSWIAALPKQVRRAVRAMRGPFEQRCPLCDAPLTAVSDTPTTVTSNVICWRREAECARCGNYVVKQVVQLMPDGL